MPRRHDPFSPTAAELVRQAAERETGGDVLEYARQQAELARAQTAARQAAKRIPTEAEFVAVLNARFNEATVEEPLTRAEMARRRQEEIDPLEAAYALPAIGDEDRDPPRPQPFAEVGEIAVGPDLSAIWRDDSMYDTFRDIQNLPVIPPGMPDN